MSNKLLHSFAVLGVSLLSTWPVSGAELAGTYSGTFVCDATEYAWLLVIQPPQGKRVIGETIITRPGPAGDESGRHRMKGKFDTDRSVLTLKGNGWVERLRGQAQIGFRYADFDSVAGVIGGKLNDKRCGTFELQRTSDSIAFSAPAAKSSGSVASTPTPQISGQDAPPTQTTTPPTLTRQLSPQPQVAANPVTCDAVRTWSRIVELAYPDADYNSFRPHYRLADLFLDEHFKPVFGKPYTEMGQNERKALWQKSMAACFKPVAGKENEFIWQRQELNRPFILRDGPFSRDEVLEYLSLRQVQRAWLTDAIAKLEAADGDEKALKSIIAEGGVRMIGLPLAEKAEFRRAAALVTPAPDIAIDPAVTNMVNTHKQILPRDRVYNPPPQIARIAARQYDCDIGHAADSKTAFLEQVSRLYPENMFEAEEAFDREYERLMFKRVGCGYIVVFMYTEDGHEAIDYLANLRVSNATGQPLGPKHEGLPNEYFTPLPRQDDPDQMFPVMADGRVIQSSKISGLGQGIGIAVASLTACDAAPTENYREIYLDQVKRFYDGQNLAAAQSLYDSGLRTDVSGSAIRSLTGDKLSTPPLPCSPSALDGYRASITENIKQLQDYTAVTRGELVAEIEKTGFTDHQNLFDPDLYAHITGEYSEVTRLGKGLTALEAGVIWSRKYQAKYREIAGPEFFKNLRFLTIRRILDGKDAMQELVDGLNSAQTRAEVELFLSRYLSVSGDKAAGSLGRYLELAITRNIEIGKQAQFAKIVARNEGRAKASGIIGEVELMQAYVNSRYRAVNFTRILSGHSFSVQDPFEKFRTYHISTVLSGSAHQCEEASPNLYHCIYSLEVDMAFAPGFEKFTKISDLLQYKMHTRRVKMDHHEDTFARDAKGWYSPSAMQSISDGIDDMVNQLQAIEDSIPENPFPEPEF